MNIFLTIWFTVNATICLLGVIAERDAHKRKSYTVCFGISAALVLAVNIIGGVL